MAADDSRRTALRMIPYGLYVMAAETEDGDAAAASVTWVSQASFEPPLIMCGVKTGSRIHTVAREARAFSINVLGRDQAALAQRFFKGAGKEGDTIGGEAYRRGKLGAPILESTPGYLELELDLSLEKGDHSIFVGEIVDAGVRGGIEGRPDAVTLTLKDVGEKLFYGG